MPPTLPLPRLLREAAVRSWGVRGPGSGERRPPLGSRPVPSFSSRRAARSAPPEGREAQTAVAGREPSSVEEPWRVCGAILDPNEHYADHKVRFETVSHVPSIFDCGDFLSIIDLKAAYHSLLVQERLARQFGFKWKQLYWELMTPPLI